MKRKFVCLDYFLYLVVIVFFCYNNLQFFFPCKKTGELSAYNYVLSILKKLRVTLLLMSVFLIIKSRIFEFVYFSFVVDNYDVNFSFEKLNWSSCSSDRHY